MLPMVGLSTLTRDYFCCLAASTTPATTTATTATATTMMVMLMMALRYWSLNASAAGGTRFEKGEDDEAGTSDLLLEVEGAREKGKHPHETLSPFMHWK